MLAEQPLKITTRAYTKDDYALLVSWWVSYKEWGQAVPEDLLSNDGYVVEVNGTPVAAGFLYVAQNSKCSWAEWIVADPKAGKVERTAALETLYTEFGEGAKKLGSVYMLTCTKHPRLMSRLEEMGFMKGDTEMTMMIRRVD